MGKSLLCDWDLLFLIKRLVQVPVESGTIWNHGLDSRKPRFYCDHISKFNYGALSCLVFILVDAEWKHKGKVLTQSFFIS